MTHLLFVETSGPGVQALEYGVAAGHRVTLLRSPEYDFFASPQVRERATATAHRTLSVDDVRDVPAVLARLRAEDVRPDAVLSTLHFTTPAAARIAAELGVRGTAPAAIDTARDKDRCRRAVRAAGIPSVGSVVVEDVAQGLAALAALRPPVIVKPVEGMAKAVTTIVHDEDGMRAHFAAVRERTAALAPELARDLDGRFVVEELAVGPLFSIEVATDGERYTPLVIVRRKTGRDNPVLELGSSVPSGLTADRAAAMNDYAVRVCRAVGMDLGIFHVELILTADGPQLVEINPRIAGGAIPDLVRAATGQDLFGVLVDLYAGRPVPPDPFPATAAASHSFLTAATDCRVRDDLPEDWFEHFRARLHSGWSDITPGAALHGMGTNLDVRGVVRVVRDARSRGSGSEVTEAEAECTRLLSEIEGVLGVEFVAHAAR